MNDQPSTTTELKGSYFNNAPNHSSATLGAHMNTLKQSAIPSSSQTLISSTQGQRPAAMQKNVAPFLNKVYNMVNDPSSDELIRWAADGKSFFVVRHEDFARSVLPRFFKHSNFSSFVRQLNMYGFHKVPHLQHGVLHSDNESEQWEFSNPHFQRNQPDLLLLVTRKKGRETDEKETLTAPTSTNIDLQHILDEIQVIKQHQLNISSQLKTIQSDNSVLWQESISSREQHERHQETIDKILRFLASVFSNDKQVAISRKRRYLLEAPDTDNKDRLDIEHQRHDYRNNNGNATIINKDKERPTKVSKTNKMPEFNLEDFVPGLQEFTGMPTPTTTLPSSTSPSMETTNPTSELDDAIALNDKSKQTSSVPSLRLPMSLPQDLTQMMSIQQIQGLQTLISLAQSNPALLSQLTTDVFNTYQHQGVTANSNNIPSTAPASTSTPEYSHANHTTVETPTNNVIATIPPSSSAVPQQRQPNGSITGANRPDQHTNTKTMDPDLPAPIQPRPSTNTNAIQNNNEIDGSASQNSNGIHLIQPANISTAQSTGTVSNSSDTQPSLPQVSTGVQPLSKSAEDINSDIDTLGSNIEALAQQLGFDPTKSNEDILNYVDMDQFLQSYDPGDHPVTNNMDSIYPSETIHPPNSNTTSALPPTEKPNRNV
ncbi:hypothetical protein BCR42DRAFT_353050 [Absidia repens]|uniref:HSF-type DNA-binding domain-containing protein n=1 Tax=Absidia repens TaxID=90262 RepID=A0A1X2IEN0_9FUNG|nr:hypothetical protein BCR42DRAFT_353050 [Absidia repens]